MKKYVKAIAALLGALTPGAVVGILAVFGVELDERVAAGIIGAAAPLLSLLATWRAPANAPGAAGASGPPRANSGGD